MITVEQYLNHWRVNYDFVKVPDAELTQELRDNAIITVAKANALLAAFAAHWRAKDPLVVPERRERSRGWRPRSVNDWMVAEHERNPKAPRAAKRSNHILCRAIDIGDGNGNLDRFCVETAVLTDLDLWIEHPDSTLGWCHVQIVSPALWDATKPRWYKPF